MVKVTYKNGVVLEWDDTLTVGELVTAYENGYHILTRIKFRGDDETPLMHYVMVVKADGTRVKKSGVTRECDASYVRRLIRDDVERIFDREHNAAVIKRDNLLNFVPG